ncbi:exodeoxyribonuclease-3 [Zymomonas mobilis]|uniref:exodeoxyribonuclease III n=1 Tax=Zymomonas mobilis TaxID=542 RepID=UPI00026D874A|nr:exodeoxyribonuclease III [Zymomonas mobilis]AFN57283.1 exodeoxyribonuclease III Xth [Zymomonas mobilis subsp. mobilis ATCC 29191]TQK78954.1 exodeoxyribonuclease-3 [Zymomonas mobilis]TQL14836.1 exodeoxyribonuclease-3 [Zymomonas mobilis]GEB87291.1 exodeoxyribonuclease III [Zymomonas mobilis subsp. mobilis]
MAGNILRIVSWNINSVRARLAHVERFLKEEQPDILCLQETKATNGVFPSRFFYDLGYIHQAVHGQPGYNGVAILSRIAFSPAEMTSHDWQNNQEARHIGITLENGVRLENVYIPAGGDIPDRDLNPKFGQKLDFISRMIEWSSHLEQPTILVGDFNIAPLESDVWSHKQLLKVVSHTPIEVDHLSRLQASHNWIDLGRHFYPAPERLYTWWSYRSKDWTKSDRGRRLDHMWASPSLIDHLVGHKVYESCRSWIKPSDHVPLLTEFSFHG